MRGRSPIGAGTGSGLTARVVGTNYGAETVTLDSTSLPTHSHSNTVSGGNTGGMSANESHSHQLINNAGSAAGSVYGLLDRVGNSTNNLFTDTKNLAHTHSFTPSISNANAGSGGSHANVPPVIAMSYIIKT
jgi:microcystin-dependent protein